MVTGTTEFNMAAVSEKTLEDIVLDAGDLAALPQVILKLIDLTADPKVSAADVERVIQTDQGTTARVLTLANSSYYGLPRRISSVRDAVVFLGFKSVRNLAMQVTAFNMFVGKSDYASLARRDLWKHSLYAALNTRIIYKWLNAADAERIEAEDAFTAALLHDMGKMGLESSYPANYAMVLSIAEKTSKAFHEFELDYMPFTHAVVGSAMAQRWSLPDSLCDTILNHHTPMESQICPQLTAVVSLADDIANGRLSLDADEADDTEESPAGEDAMTILGLTTETLSRINQACKVEMSKGLALSSF